MAKRTEHLFQFTGRQISAAAQAEHDYHKDRLGYWKGRQDVAADRAREAGVEVREIDVTGGKRIDVVLDPTVTAELYLCSTKISSHRTAADQFQIQAATYGSNAERSFELHPDDVIYFRLAGGPRDE